MNSQNHKNIESLLVEVTENGIVSKAQLYRDLMDLTDNFDESILQLLNEDINIRIKDLEFKYKPIDWSKPFNIVAPKVYNQKMSVIKNHLTNLNDLVQFILDKNIGTNKEFSFKNRFDNINEEIVFEYFHNALVNSKYLTEEDFKRYIILAFDKCELPEKKFSLNQIPTKKKVIKVFYEYYKDVAGKPKGQINYVKLLGEYFQGFNTSSLRSNFSKTY